MKETAYHEAAHALIALHHSLDFEGIEILATEPSSDGTSVRAGQMFGLEPLDGSNLEASIFSLLAGPAAKQIISPSHKGFSLWLGGPGGDLREALQIFRDLGFDDKQSDKLIKKYLRLVRAEVQASWRTVIRIGDALLKSPERCLSRDEVLRLADLASSRRH